MKLYLATSNKGKVREIQALFSHLEVIPYSEVIPPFEIIEDGDTFKANAIIKSEAVYKALKDEDALVLADDSGISVAALDYAPGIYSARYAGEEATDKDNLNKVIDGLKAKGITESPAFYTAAISLTSKYGTEVVHGWMYGKVIDHPQGDGGFGYDPIFIPQGYDQTLGELSDAIKSKLSHRSQALSRIEIMMQGMGLLGSN